ncbi:carbohydrate kinase family protein [Patescibacteria group bacterium]|nr:MAG: carbohydrate kinase family protein [Patescibacteria group bacterium]
MAGFDLITIGAATIDAFVWSKAFRLVKSRAFSTGVGECLSLGSKIEIDKFVLGTGGGGTNSAATFANLGFKTACLTAVGDDLFGQGVLGDLKTRRVASVLVQRIPGGQTAFSTILVVPSGERTILVSRGVAEHLSEKMLPRRFSAKWIYMTSLGGNLKFGRKIFSQAKKSGTSIFWNPGAKDLVLGAGRLKPFLKQVEVLDMNREEAMKLTGRPLGDLAGMLRDLDKIGSRLVLLTDGEKGAYLSEGGQLWRAHTHRHIKVVNKTGAGDAFGSGFLAGLIKYRDRTRALQLGVLNSESVIQKIGAKTGLLTNWPSKNKLAGVKVTAVAKS